MMDWREFFRGFFGGHRRSDSDVWPPVPPIRELFENDRKGNEDSSTSNSGRGRYYPFGSEWDRRGSGSEGERGGRTGPSDDEIHDFPGREFGGNSFVFGNMFSMMGEVMQEMDRAMREMDRAFGDFRIGDQFGMFPPNCLPPATPNLEGRMLPPPPPSGSAPKPSNPPDDSVRDLVLKEPDASKSHGRHYLDQPKKSEDKVDKDLDDLYNKSMLDLSELPIPSGTDKRTEDSGTQTPPQNSRIIPFGFGFHGGESGSGDWNSYRHSYQKTYQTYTFRNGKWEGEVVNEDSNGKSVTKYFVDENGQNQQVTEYFPKGSDPGPVQGQLQDGMMEPYRDFEGPNLFGLFDRFFRPRM